MKTPIHALRLLLATSLAACAAAPAPTPETVAPPATSAPAALVPAAPAEPGVDVVKDVAVPPSIAALLGAPDRSDDDRKLDPQRHPGEMLGFFGITPGMKVAELGAGGGYTAELLARAVGPTGVVYGQNSKFILDRFADKPWSDRLQRPAMKGVVRVNREFVDPLPPEVTGLDAVFIVLFYHDTVWMEVDRAKMNAAIFRALKPGGVLAVIDHSGRAGTGSTETKTLHRIEEKVVREEVQAAGFRLAAEATFLRNASDPRDWNDSPSAAGDKRGTSDRFVLKFVKP